MKEKFFTERDKTLFKLFFFTFMIFSVILNWSDFSLFLNFRTAPRVIEQSFRNFFNNLSIEREEEETINEIEVEDLEEFIYCQEDSINIPSLGINAPIVETIGTSEREYRQSLDTGVVRFPNSVYPGEKGLTVLLGHSAPPGWPDINYDSIFTQIDKLEEGDVIEICYNNRMAFYEVIDEERGKKVYEVGEDVPPLYPDNKKKELVLMTCWPPGDSENRMGVRAIID